METLTGLDTAGLPAVAGLTTESLNIVSFAVAFSSSFKIEYVTCIFPADIFCASTEPSAILIVDPVS